MNEKRRCLSFHSFYLRSVIREQERRKEGEVSNFHHMSDKEPEAYRKELVKEGRK